MGYAPIRGVLKKGTSIENNVNQTIASGMNTAGTGVVFTLPAIFMLYGNTGQTVELMPFIVAAIAGTLLGIVFIIPLRKQMIDIDRLRFPSGVAVTTIIRSGSGGIAKAKLLGIGFAISAAWKMLLSSGLIDIEGIIAHEEFDFGFGVIPSYLYPVLYLSLMNLAAGLLAGKGIAFLYWRCLSLVVCLACCCSSGMGPRGGDLQGDIYGSMLRPLGIGTLIGGALISVILTFPAIKAAIQSLINAGKAGSMKGGNDELPAKVLGFGIVGAALLLGISASISSDISIGQTILVSVVGVVWMALAALIVAQATGMTDISPMSGMALITVTIVMFLLNKNISAAMVIAVAVCVAIGQAADMMQDLKTGFMIGGTPAKQQLAQFGTTWIGAIVSVFAIYVLWNSGPGGSNGFGEGTPLPAPQAGVLMGIIEGLVPVTFQSISMF